MFYVIWFLSIVVGLYLTDEFLKAELKSDGRFEGQHIWVLLFLSFYYLYQ
jgi:hypothetical protein